MSKHIYNASDYAALDSDVILGGGTDDTIAIQALLDKSKTEGQVYIIMDGAALVSGLTIHSNTTIECLNASCGFYLLGGSNRAIFRNANINFKSPNRDMNITFIGGSYNHNAKEQEHHVPFEEGEQALYNDVYGKLDVFEGVKWVMAFEMYGVENFTMRDLTIYNQRTFSMLFANFKYVNMENINIILNDYISANNQDGIHFWGPGQFLNMRNITGCSGDDFIALAPDEHDGVSSITDVFIDGVHLNNADQGIRLLSRGTGALDRILIKNVTGTYRGFGFIINPWFNGVGGNYKSIVIDTVDLRCVSQAYSYMKPFLFKLGGNIENLVLKNINQHGDICHNTIQIGGLYCNDGKATEATPSKIDTVTIDGLYVYNDKFDTEYVEVNSDINNLIIRNAQILRENFGGRLIKINNQSKINNHFINEFASTNLADGNKMVYPSSLSRDDNMYSGVAD